MVQGSDFLVLLEELLLELLVLCFRLLSTRDSSVGLITERLETLSFTSERDVSLSAAIDERDVADATRTSLILSMMWLLFVRSGLRVDESSGEWFGVAVLKSQSLGKGTADNQTGTL